MIRNDMAANPEPVRVIIRVARRVNKPARWPVHRSAGAVTC